MAARVIASRTAIQLAQRDAATATQLFDVLSQVLPADQAGRTGITVYDTAGRPLAWAGRVLDLAKERLGGPAALFVAPGALGPRLVRVEPVADPRRPGGRQATVVVEQSLSGLQPTTGLAAGAAVVSTSIVPVSIRTEFEGPGPPDEGDDAARFLIPSPTGGLLVEARVSRAALAEARARWRARTLRRERARHRRRPAAVRRAAARRAPPRADGSRVSLRNRRDRPHPDRRALVTAVDRFVGGGPSTVWLVSLCAAGGPDSRRLRRACRRLARPAALRPSASAALAAPESAGARRLAHCGGVRRRRRHRRGGPGRIRTVPAGGRRPDKHRRRPFLAASVQRARAVGRFRPRAAARRRSLGRRDGRPRAGRVLAAPPALGPSGDGDMRMARRRRSLPSLRFTRSVESIPLAPWIIALAACGLCARGVRTGVAPLPAQFPGGAARGALRRAGRAGARDVSVALLSRDGGEGTADRIHVRAAGGQSAQGSPGSPLSGARTDRRAAQSRRLRLGPVRPRRPRSTARSPSGREPSLRPTGSRPPSSCTAPTGGWSAASRSACPNTPPAVTRRRAATGRSFDEVLPFGSQRAPRAPRRPRHLRPRRRASARSSCA